MDKNRSVPINNPNILLIVLDSVRSKTTSNTVSNVPVTPYLNSLKSESTMYTQARAPSSWSLPSHVSIFTGAHADEHGIHSVQDRLEPGHTIFEELAEDGYYTGVFSENVFLTQSENGLKDAFNYVHKSPNARFPKGLNPDKFVFEQGEGEYIEYLKHCLTHENPIKSILNGLDKLAPRIPFIKTDFHTPGTVLADSFLDWAVEVDSPWAATINFMDAHTPYVPEELYDADKTVEKLRGEISDYAWGFHTGKNPWWLLKAMKPLYKDSIRQADQAVKLVVEGLREADMLDETLVVITSDHGEGFGEQSEIVKNYRVVGHGQWSTEELLHVPLLVRKPGQKDGEVKTGLSSLTKFAEVVRNTREGGAPSFATDRALASVHWQDYHVPRDEVIESIDVEEFSTPAKVVYENREHSVKKFAVRGKNSTELLITPQGVKYEPMPPSRYSPAEIVESAFEPLKEVSFKSDKEAKFDDDVMDRLEDLGYA